MELGLTVPSGLAVALDEEVNSPVPVLDESPADGPELLLFAVFDA